LSLVRFGDFGASFGEFGLNLTDSETYRGEMIYMWLAVFYWTILRREFWSV